jgi:hypothetical protein
VTFLPEYEIASRFGHDWAKCSDSGKWRRRFMPATINLATGQTTIDDVAQGDDSAAAEMARQQRSQFEKLRDYIADQIGAIKRVEAEQQSAERLLDLAESELGDLRREFEQAMLPPRKA